MSLPKFTMPFEPTTVDHLGLQLYGTLPPVISELVSNAYDAESKRIEIELPKGAITPDAEVIIRDYGHGLTAEEIQAEFLPIGRLRRGDDGTNVMSRHGKVRVTGRKGLGKLSAFGVATEVETRFVQDKQAVCLRLNYNDLRAWPAKHGSKDYEPEVVKERTGPTTEKDGAEIRLRKLHRTRPISEGDVRRGLARRLSFIGSKFVVVINDQQIKPGDRVQKKDCAKGFRWEIGDTPGKGLLSTGEKVTGWLGFLETSSQTNRGIDIFANEKAAELGSFFNLSTTHAQFARAHLIGEAHADFLDAEKDNIATARNSVVWDSSEGMALQEWGQKTLTWAFEQWVALRQKEKQETVFSTPGFEEWLKTRLPGEQRVARRMVDQLISDEAIEAKSAPPLLEIIKSSVESVAFHDLIDRIENEGANAATLLRLFAEWRVIEARDHLRRADGRLEAMTQLREFIDRDALEVQQMQPLFENHPWLINTAWSETDSQTTYTKLLRKHCVDNKEQESDRRLDILGITVGGSLTVVELKRPYVALSRRSLRQIEDYVVWARTNILGTGPHSPKYIEGLLIIGKRTSNAELAEIEKRLSGFDIRVETFRDLYQRAKEYYGFVEEQLQAVAPEYTRKHRKAQRRKS